jgi:hypothetical protein
MGEREERLMDQVLDFDQTRVKPSECIFKWRAIAQEVGLSEATLRRFFAARGFKLPRWGIGGKGGDVFLPKSKIAPLKAALFGV